MRKHCSNLKSEEENKSWSHLQSPLSFLGKLFFSCYFHPHLPMWWNTCWSKYIIALKHPLPLPGRPEFFLNAVQCHPLTVISLSSMISMNLSFSICQKLSTVSQNQVHTNPTLIPCAQCTPCKASVLATFLLTLWGDWTNDFGAVGHQLWKYYIYAKQLKSLVEFVKFQALHTQAEQSCIVLIKQVFPVHTNRKLVSQIHCHCHCSSHCIK